MIPQILHALAQFVKVFIGAIVPRRREGATRFFACSLQADLKHFWYEPFERPLVEATKRALDIDGGFLAPILLFTVIEHLAQARSHRGANAG